MLICKFKEKGYLSIELVIVLAVALLMMVMGSSYYLNYLDDQTAAAAAERQKQVNSALSSYLKSNFSIIATAITTTTQKYPITLATIEAAGYLPTGFSTSKNIFGQSWSMVVMEPSANLLRSLIVTTGGEVISEKLLRKTAIKTGALGGYISASNSAVAAGTQGAWNATLALYGLNPGAGHIASQVTMTDPAQTGEYFYRNSVPGHAELNRMTTDIDMNAKNISGAATVTGVTINATNSSVSNTLSAGAVNAKTVSTTGNISATGNITSTGGVSGSYVRGALYTAGSTCSNPGSIGYDSSGSLLNCSSGTWSAVSGGALTVELQTNPSSIVFPTAAISGCSNYPYSYVGGTVTAQFYNTGVGYITLTDADYNFLSKAFTGKIYSGTLSFNQQFTYSVYSGSASGSVTYYLIYSYKVLSVTKTAVTYQLLSNYLSKYTSPSSFYLPATNCSNFFSISTGTNAGVPNNRTVTATPPAFSAYSVPAY